MNIKLSDQNQLVYNLNLNGKEIIKDSKLGIDLVDQPDFINGFEINKIDTTSFYEVWKPVWGEVDKIINNYNQMQIALIQPNEKRIMIVTFRLFNDGLGFRYEFPVQENLKYFIVSEKNTQ